MTSELLQQVRILDPLTGTDTTGDVLIVDHIIKDIAPQISNPPPNTQHHNCDGLILGPGLTDLYSLGGEPGYEDRETLDSFWKSASAGGFTRVAMLPATHPPIDNPGALSLLQTRAKMLQPASNLYFWGALTIAIAGQQMTEFAELASAGIVGFADGVPVQNLALLRRILEYLKPLNIPIALWPCDRKLEGSGVMREGPDSIRLGLPGNPAISETTALAALLEVVATTGTPTHIMRVSTARSVQLIQQAKNQGIPITASTTWLHLTLDTKAIECYNPNLRIDPPLPTPQDRYALIQAIKEGIIDAIAVDHSPYSYEEKTVAFGEAPAGAIGLELALPLLWQNLVDAGLLTPLELWRSLSIGAAACLNLKLPGVTTGKAAELTLFNPKQTWKVEEKTLQSLSSNTFWLGQQIAGRVIKVWS
ncbi:dihydroorotase [Ancylothrix sp. C2]|uniref:dihydroorotase n=1 Tax=Ancylothrix sp. D3o TaxID=2953691 RepID=UPI0021BB30AF|nr:dihydroorotase [Ancylothrix sp. D3o]MCT7950472.1 dihydroorotase [Ancylothrix sp. D3o]